MIRNYFQNFIGIWRTLFVVMTSGVEIPLFKIGIRCPNCGSWMVGTNGTHERKSGRVELFICKNQECLDERRKKGFKKARQFIITTSYEYKELIRAKIKALYEDLLKDGAKNKTIAKKYSVSPAQISALRKEIENAIEQHRKLDQLVDVPQPDKAIAIDETFLKIEGKKIYVIIATGYTSRKTLGVKVSTSRAEQDMRNVFEEAERNTKDPIKTVTSDAWGATISMVKNLCRDITHVVHKHKKPYKKVVTLRYEYVDNERIITTIGVKTNAVKTRATREGRYSITKEPVTPPPSKNRGRPKGSKTKKKKVAPKEKKKRGKKGLFKVFDTGTKFYFTVDPYRKTVKLSKNLPASLDTALSDLLQLFARMSIQNNLAETKNSIIRALIGLTGPKTIESAERRIRAVLLVKNQPDILNELRIQRNVSGTFYTNNLKLIEVPTIQNKVISA